MSVVTDIALASVAGLTALQLGSAALVARRVARAPRLARLDEMPPITVLRPVCGLENHLDATLRSTFRLDGGEVQILFCVAREDDPAVPLVRALIAQHPGVDAQLLIGDDRVTGNPKLDNLVKGWAAARHDWIAMADSNLMLPRSYLRQLVGAWTPGTGLVTSPATGTAADGAAARLEAAFLNGYQARWQLLADELGQGFAQGKTLFWRRDVLEAGGGLTALGRDLAEDVASTRLVRGQGLRVRVVRSAFAQPLGRRGWAEVWRRQVRWARVRRLGFPLLYAGEILSGALVPLLLLAGLALAGVVPALLLPLVAVLWYGAEMALAARAGWPGRAGDLGAAVLRDLMLPAVWVAGWAGKGFTWRGNAMEAGSVRPEVAG